MRQSIHKEFLKNRHRNEYFHYEIKDGKRVGRSANILGILRSTGKLPTILRGCIQTRHSDFDFKHTSRKYKKNNFVIKARNPLNKRISLKEMKNLMKNFEF